MSVNVYLKEEVKKIEGFTTRQRRAQAQGGEIWNEYEIPGVKLYYKEGRWHITLSEGTNSVPSVVADIVDSVSLREFIPIRPKRESGSYHHESAEAEVTSYGEKHAQVIIAGKEIKDVFKLFRMIKIGSIRPDESYEGEQGGMSRAELFAALGEVEGELQKIQGELQNLHDANDDKNQRTRLERLAAEVARPWWPFCIKSHVLFLIREAMGKHIPF